MSERETSGDEATAVTPDEAQSEDAKVAAAADPVGTGKPGGSTLVRVLVVVVVFLAGVATWPLTGPWLAPAPPVQDSSDGDAVRQQQATLKAISTRIAGLEERLKAMAAERGRAEAERGKLNASIEDQSKALKALDERLGMVSSPSGDNEAGLAALAERLEALAAELDASRGAAPDVETTRKALDATVQALRVDLTGLGDRLAALEAASTGQDGESGQRQALVLAVGQLAGAVGAGRPFASELAQVRTFAGDDGEVGAALALLDGGAKAGIATLADLRRRFEPLAGDIVRAGVSPASDGWLGQAGQRLVGLVTVRRVGEVAGGEVDAIVARAETRLVAGDLQAAAGEIATLEGAAAETAAPWRQAAEARLLADRALARLQARAIERLGQS